MRPPPVCVQSTRTEFGCPNFQQELARELVRDGKSISAVARTFYAHPATIYRVLDG